MSHQTENGNFVILPGRLMKCGNCGGFLRIRKVPNRGNVWAHDPGWGRRCTFVATQRQLAKDRSK